MGLITNLRHQCVFQDCSSKDQWNVVKPALLDVLERSERGLLGKLFGFSIGGLADELLYPFSKRGNETGLG